MYSILSSAYSHMGSSYYNLGPQILKDLFLHYLQISSAHFIDMSMQNVIMG